MNDLDENIIADIKELIEQKVSPSKIMRKIFAKYGAIPPCDMAQYFKAVYSLRAIEFMYALGDWWHDASSAISDDVFDRRMQKILSSSE